MLTRFKKAVASFTIATLSLVGVGVAAVPAVAAPSFTVTNDTTSQPLTVITGTAGTPINDTYTIAFSDGDGWIFGQPGFGYGWSPSSRPNSGINYDFQLNGAPGETQTFTFTVSGTPTQGYYRDQWIQLSDDNGLTYRYEFDLAIDGVGVSNITTDPTNFTYSNPVLPNKSGLFAEVPSLYVISTVDSSRILLQPEAGTNWNKLVTENGGVTTYSFTTGDLFNDETYGSIRADVTITLTDSHYFYSVDTWSWDWEGTPVSLAVELDAPLAAGELYASQATQGSGLGVLASDNSDAFAVFSAPTPTIEQNSGIITVKNGLNETTQFTVEFFDYTGCPTVQEMVSAYDAATLTTTGYASATPCPVGPISPAGPTFSNDPLKNWYVLDWASFPTLFQVDKTTGALTVIGTSTEDFGYSAGFAALEVDSINGIGYAVIYGGDEPVAELLGIDLSTGEFSRLATFENIQNVTALDLTVDGKLWFAADYYTASEGASESAIFGWINMDNFAVTFVSEDMNGERIAALISDEDNGALYGISYSGQMYSYNDSENTWTASINLNRGIFAADFESGYVLAQGWDGDVIAIDLDTLEVTTLWNQFTMPAGLNWNGGEAFAVGGVAPVLVVNQPEPTPEPAPAPTPAPAPQPGMEIEPISIPKPVPGVTETEGFKPGAEVEIGGKRLAGLTEVMVGDKKVEFKENSDGGFVIMLPENLEPGVYDLTVVGPFGKLTYQSAIRIAALAVVVAPESNPAKATKSFSGFAPGSSVLTNKMKAEIKAWLTKYDNITRVDISGFTMGPTVLASDARLAMRRAIVVKAYIMTLDSQVKFSKLTWKTETKLGNQVRRAVVTVNYNK
jgi:outer membrane protein OmpA-like peptidoglycan-associated protein